MGARAAKIEKRKARNETIAKFKELYPFAPDGTAEWYAQDHSPEDVTNQKRLLAFVRHNFTNYDKELPKIEHGYTYGEIRGAAYFEAMEILLKWQGGA